MAKKPRRKCANQNCREWFHPARERQVVCCYECATAVAKAQTAKNRAEALRAEKKRQRDDYTRIRDEYRAKLKAM